MSSDLTEMMTTQPPLFTQSRHFRIFLEPFVPSLREHPDTTKTTLTPEIKHLHNFSLESLLLSKGLTLEDIHIIQRMNNIDDSHRLDPSLDFLLIPSFNQLNDIKSIYKNKITK